MAGDRFDVGHSAFEVGAAYRRRTDLETIFRKISRELVANYNETVQLAILLGTDVLYVSKEESSEPVRLVSDIGSRLPAHVTSLGKALLACLADEDVKLLYGSTRLKKRTPNSHGSVQTLLKDLQVIRTRGWAWDNEETSVGLQCVGGPVFDGTNESIAAISISIPVQRVTPDRIQELGRAVMHAASRMSNFLGSQESESVIGFQKN